MSASAPARPMTTALAVPRARSWRGELAFAIVLGLTVRAVLFLYGWWQLEVDPRRVAGGEWLNLAIPVSSPAYPWLGVWDHWDALWYKHLALSGYHVGDNSPHFAPLFPLLARLLMPLFQGNFEVAAITVSTIAAIIAFALLARLAALDGRPDDGRRAAFYMCAYPVGFFLFIPFTEATFLALTVGSFLLARRGHWWWAGLVGFLATLAHFQGVLLAPALCIEYALQWYRKQRKLDWAIIATGLPAAALGAFAAWVRFGLGETRSLVEIDQHWGTTVMAPWDVLRLSWQQVTANLDGTELLNLAVVLGILLACLIGLRYLRFSYVVFMAAQLIPPLVHTSYITPLESASRYLLVTFPAFLLLGRLGARPWADRAILAVFFLIQGIFLWQFVSGYWVA